MLKALLSVWLCLPLGVGLYHFGPGQERLAIDVAADAVQRGQEAAARARAVAAEQGDQAARPDWAEAEAAYTEALQLLPAERVDEVRRLRLERAKAQVFVSRLPDARRDLDALVAELESADAVDAELLSDARSALANAQYYTTWLMRLEDAPRDEWEQEIEAARQNYRLVAEEWTRRGDDERAQAASEDLESAIRLARMALADLQGLPLPSQ